MEKDKLEYLAYKWEKFITTLSVTTAVHRNMKQPQVREHLLRFTEKAFNESLLACTPYNIMGAVYAFEHPIDALNDKSIHINMRNVLTDALGETKNRLYTEMVRMDVEAKKALTIKVTDRIYNPYHNKIGYMLENGEVIFTDEIVTDSTCDLANVNVMRKINISEVLDDK
jgi:hypothetical protein